MSAQNPCFALQASSHSAELFRRALSSLIIGSGCVNRTDLKVSQNTGSDLKSQAAAGQVWMPGTQGSSTGMGLNTSQQSAYSPTSASFTSQGNYYGFNDAAITGISHSAANPTNGRIDLIVATVLDAQYSGSTNSWVVEVITGTPAGTPAAPTIPANSVVLAQIAVAANQTTITNANITDKRSFISTGYSAQSVFTAHVDTQELTNQTTLSDLLTVGPALTVTIPPSGVCKIDLFAQMNVTNAGNYALMGFAASGANTIAAGGRNLLAFSGNTNENPAFGGSFLLTGLAAGSTTFTAKYGTDSSGNDAGFKSRQLTAQIFP